MHHLLSLQELFKGRVFRIPDYQRGYSWKLEHLQAFWDDLENLQEGHIHYTGVITVERPTIQQCLNWQKEGEAFSERNWRQDENFAELLFAGRTLRPFYVVDGQQRLLTIAILLAAIIQVGTLPQSEQDTLARQFLLNESEGQSCFLFGYEVDLPSHWFLIQRIYQNRPSTEVETAYTDNLAMAKSFFLDQLEGLTANRLRLLIKKITCSVQFNYYEVDERLDVFVVFETMNNRGKGLTTLELLKNRLLYLSTLLPKDERHVLRERINACWKLIHEWLAKARKKVLRDDEFLRNHWIMYFNHGNHPRKELGNLSEDLLEKRFKVKNVRSGKLGTNDILDYVDNLGLSVQKWFELNFPYHSASTLSVRMRCWIERINTLRPQSLFRPIMLALLQKDFYEAEKVLLLQKIERHEFLVFALVNSRSDANQPHFYRKANRFFGGWMTMQALTEEIHNRVGRFYNQSKFKEYVDELFLEGEEDDRGFSEWPHLGFFLFEYEDFLRERQNGAALVDRDKFYYERVYPKSNDRHRSWRPTFDDLYTAEKCRKLCNSIGNLVLLSREPEEKLRSFAEKKRHLIRGNPQEVAGYCNGSYSEREIAGFQAWRHKEILERGVQMFGFMAQRWDIQLAEDIRKTLTQVNFGIQNPNG